MSPRPKSPGPDYYALADGRQLYELERDEIVQELARRGMGIWDSHCLLSAIEHRFRRGAKEGETETDIQSEAFWIAQMSWPGIEIEANKARIQARIDAERKAVGR